MSSISCCSGNSGGCPTRSEVIGEYRGREIYAWVVFMGMRYRFDRVAQRAYRDWVAEGELFLEPGLIYVTD